MMILLTREGLPRIILKTSNVGDWKYMWS